MTLAQYLNQHYIPQPERMNYVKVNEKETRDFDQELVEHDIVEVDWPHVGIRIWVYPEP